MPDVKMIYNCAKENIFLMLHVSKITIKVGIVYSIIELLETTMFGVILIIKKNFFQYFEMHSCYTIAVNIDGWKRISSMHYKKLSLVSFISFKVKH